MQTESQQTEEASTHNATIDALDSGVVVQGTLTAMIKAQKIMIRAQQELVTELERSLSGLQTVLQAER